jgi:uncharacterized Zn finger protein
MTKKRSKTDVFNDLTWEDLQEWAGTGVVSRGQNYQRHHHVEELARTPDGGIIAWVQGTQRYATLIDVEEGDVISVCTCPYGGTCKHAVAVVLEYLEHLKQKVEVPTTTERDRRFTMLKGMTGEEAWEEEGGDDEEGGEEMDGDRSTPQRSGRATVDTLHAFFERQTKADLIALLEDMAGRYPEVREALQDPTASVGRGDSGTG